MDNVSIQFSVNRMKLPFLRKALKTLLTETVCRIKFEKVDGTESEMKCTLIPKFLPPLKDATGKTAEEKDKNTDTLPVFKLDDVKSGWRSFRLDGLKSVEVLYE